MANKGQARARILAAAAAEFAARGFAGASVDRIARRARANKALIYYHFKSKAALYGETLRQTFRETGEQVRAIATQPISPEEKIKAFVTTLIAQIEGHPHLLPSMLRELAERGSHLDSETVRILSVLPETLMAIVGEGLRTGVFRKVHPVLVYATLVGPAIFYFASAPVRPRVSRLGVAGFEGPETRELVRHIQTVVLALLRSDRGAAHGSPQGDQDAPSPR
jgi:TetR/AcrR family transcriptional regulator